MKKRNQCILCVVLLILGLLGFYLQLFVFEAPDGSLGLVYCIVCIYMILGSIIRLCKLSQKFRNGLFDFLDLLFFIK